MQAHAKGAILRKTKFPSSEEVPVLGQGTWGFVEHPENRQNEIDALRFGIDIGMKLIDTAEMYGDGAAEELIGKAIEGRRKQTFIVDKVLPLRSRRPTTKRYSQEQTQSGCGLKRGRSSQSRCTTRGEQTMPFDNGAWAEYMLVPEHYVAPVPVSLSLS